MVGPRPARWRVENEITSALDTVLCVPELRCCAGPLTWRNWKSFERGAADGPTLAAGFDALILSMRGVPLIDTSGLQVLAALHERLQQAGGTLMLAGAHDNVLRMLERGGLLPALGPENVFWSADQAIVAAEQRECGFCRTAETV